MYTEKSLKEKSNSSNTDNFSIVLIALMTFFPMLSIFNFLRFAIVFILFFSLIVKKNIVQIDIKLSSIFGLMVLGLLLPRITVIIIEGNANSGLWTHELLRIIFYIMLIFVIYNYKVSSEFLFKICIITLFVHVSIQTLQLMGVEAVFDFIETYYLEAGDTGIHLSLARTRNIASFRSGSIYMNPNVYMVIPLTILSVILQRDKIKYSIKNIFLIFVVLYSLLLTGSRTTLIVGLCMVVYYIVKREELGGLRWIALGIGLVILIASIGSLASNYRAFNITDGLSSSLDVKMERIYRYFLNSNPIYLITGSLSSTQTVGMDSEWGHIYTYFGIIGLIWYINFLKLLSRNKEKYPLQSKLLVLNVCLVAISASVILCMPVFSFVCLVSLAKIE